MKTTPAFTGRGWTGLALRLGTRRLPSSPLQVLALSNMPPLKTAFQRCGASGFCMRRKEYPVSCHPFTRLLRLSRTKSPSSVRRTSTACSARRRSSTVAIRSRPGATPASISECFFARTKSSQSPPRDDVGSAYLRLHLIALPLEICLDRRIEIRLTHGSARFPPMLQAMPPPLKPGRADWTFLCPRNRVTSAA